jgi:hypothetical protein
MYVLIPTTLCVDKNTNTANSLMLCLKYQGIEFECPQRSMYKVLVSRVGVMGGATEVH